MHTYTVEPLYVPSGDETIAADFYLPKSNIKPTLLLWRMVLLDYVSLN